MKIPKQPCPACGETINHALKIIYADREEMLCPKCAVVIKPEEYGSQPNLPKIK